MVGGHGEELKADLIVHEIVTRNPHPVQGAPTFNYPLLLRVNSKNYVKMSERVAIAERLSRQLPT